MAATWRKALGPMIHLLEPCPDYRVRLPLLTVTLPRSGGHSISICLPDCLIAVGETADALDSQHGQSRDTGAIGERLAEAALISG